MLSDLWGNYFVFIAFTWVFHLAVIFSAREHLLNFLLTSTLVSGSIANMTTYARLDCVHAHIGFFLNKLRQTLLQCGWEMKVYDNGIFCEFAIAIQPILGQMQSLPGTFMNSYPLVVSTPRRQYSWGDG